MTTMTRETRITPEELLNLPDNVNYELVDGKLVERHIGFESREIAARILGLLWMFLHDKQLGKLAGADASYQCFPNDRGKVRKPDVSFIRAGRLPNDRSPTGHCPIAPDLAVEVVSPGDETYELEQKIAQYLEAGVQLVWVVYPPTHLVRVHRPEGSPLGVISQLTQDQEITGEQVLPGFSCKVSQFFA